MGDDPVGELERRGVVTQLVLYFHDVVERAQRRRVVVPQQRRPRAVRLLVDLQRTFHVAAVPETIGEIGPRLERVGVHRAERALAQRERLPREVERLDLRALVVGEPALRREQRAPERIAVAAAANGRLRELCRSMAVGELAVGGMEAGRLHPRLRDDDVVPGGLAFERRLEQRGRRRVLAELVLGVASVVERLGLDGSVVGARRVLDQGRRRGIRLRPVAGVIERLHVDQLAPQLVDRSALLFGLRRRERRSQRRQVDARIERRQARRSLDGAIDRRRVRVTQQSHGRLQLSLPLAQTRHP